MPYSLAEAAEPTGLYRSTILRAIKSGRISGQRDDTGAWSVEPIELHRVFAPKAEPEAQPPHAQPVGQTDALVAQLRDQLAEMRAQRDAWHGVAEPSAARARAAKADDLVALAALDWVRTASSGDLKAPSDGRSSLRPH